MGADMLIARMRAPHREGVNPWDIDLTEAERIGHERIDAYEMGGLDDDDLDNLSLDLGLGGWDIDEVSDCDSADREVARKQLVADLRSALHGALTELCGNRRDVAFVTFDGRRYWLTGGMSWGDAPTDAFEWIVAFDWIGLYDEPLP